MITYTFVRFTKGKEEARSAYLVSLSGSARGSAAAAAAAAAASRVAAEGGPTNDSDEVGLDPDNAAASEPQDAASTVAARSSDAAEVSSSITAGAVARVVADETEGHFNAGAAPSLVAPEASASAAVKTSQTADQRSRESDAIMVLQPKSVTDSTLQPLVAGEAAAYKSEAAAQPPSLEDTPNVHCIRQVLSIVSARVDYALFCPRRC